MIGESRPMLLARAVAFVRPPRELDGELDLPAIAHPALGLKRSVTALSVATLIIVAVTAPTRVSSDYTLSDVGTLLLLYAIGAFGVSRLPWGRLPASAAVAMVGVQVLFVATLTTVTGGGQSAYFVLYAPILALAGWFLRREWVLLTVVSVAVVESWRAMVVEGGSGNADQLLVALPLFAAIAGLAHLTAGHLLGAMATIRRDQRRTAETLAAVREMAAQRDADPLAVASAAAARIFDSRARLLAFEAPATDGAEILARSEHGRRLSVGITGATGTHAVLELERQEPFSITEARLAGLLGGTAGQAADGRRRGVHV